MVNLCEIQSQMNKTARCFADKNIGLLLSHFPSGINVKANARVVPGLSQSIDFCQERESEGFIKIRIKANQIYRAGRDRDECLRQLTQDEEMCRSVRRFLCSYSYGIDLSCLPADPNITRRRVAVVDQCSDAIRALETSK